MPRLREIGRAKLAALAAGGDPEQISPFSWQMLDLFGAFPAVLDRHVTEFFPHLFAGEKQYYGKTLGVDCYSVEEIIAYGASVRTKVDAWWGRVEDKSCQKKLKTFFGPCVAHDLLERSTWHSAQHCRQLADVLKRFGIEPDQPLTQDQLAGLPLPERLYE